MAGGYIIDNEFFEDKDSVSKPQQLAEDSVCGQAAVSKPVVEEVPDNTTEEM